jgi:tyrosyl-tRNA synthetase
VALYHGARAADGAFAEFDRVHKNKELPEDIASYKLADQAILNILTLTKLAKSNSEAKRLIDQGGVKINGEVCKEYTKQIAKNSIVQVGKRNFAKIV